jgi:hypothetical protein
MAEKRDCHTLWTRNESRRTFYKVIIPGQDIRDWPDRFSELLD